MIELKQKVQLADRMYYLNQFPDKFFDWAVDDPPYFSGPERRGYYGRSESTTLVKRVEYGKHPNWEVPGREYFDLLIRKSKNQIIWGVNYYDYIFGHGRIIWDKVNQSSSFSDCEIAYCSAHDSVRLFRFMWNGMNQGKGIYDGHIMQGNKKLNEKRIHTCQKPIALYRWTFKKYCKPGDKIGSFHLGSGSDRIAAYDLGLDFYACEKHEKTFYDQEARFEAYVNQSKYQHKLIL